MPSFEPPLGCTTVITIPPGDQRRFAHLTSQLSFGQDEDDTGSWEIWTDLALVREDGKRVYGDGAWHAMKFERVEDEKEEDEVLQQHGSGPVFRLQSASSQPAQAYRPRCLQARGVISASVGSAWSYTFRRVLPNGEVHWLGQEGGNGVIRVDIAEEVQSSSTTHTAEDGEGVLQGMAVQLPSSSHASPKLQLLPAESHVTADMIFVIKTPPIHMPFYIITYDARPPPAHGTRPTHVVSIAPRGQSYDIEAGSSHAKSTAQNASSAECAGAALEQAISKSVGANQIIPATVSGANAADIVAFFIHGSEIGSGETDTACSYLVIYAAASSIDRLVWIGRSFGTTDDAPLVVLNATIQHMLLRSEDQGSNEKLPVWVPSGGPVAQILELGTFCQLRGTGDGKLINVCLPGATSIEVGEEEIDQDAIDGNTVKLGGNAASNGTQRELGAEQDGDGVGGTSMDADEASVHTDATPELEESIISQDEQPESKEPALWILRLVGRFLMNLFNALFSTFGFGQKRTTGSDKQLREAGDDDDDEIEAGARTPVDVDERTPLLQSEMSRSTTASGPLSDALAPFSENLVPLKDAFISSDGMTTPNKEDHPRLSIPSVSTKADLVSPLLTPIEKRVQIRSYLRFCLPSTTMAYHCLLLPGSSLKDTVKVSTRSGEQWKTVGVLETPREGQCTEVHLVGVEGGAEIEMETVQ